MMPVKPHRYVQPHPRVDAVFVLCVCVRFLTCNGKFYTFRTSVFAKIR
jgi:hypothetical protein